MIIFCEVRPHQLVLVGSDSSELSLWEDKGSIFLLLNVLHRPRLTLPSLYQVDSRLELVHRVQDDLGKFRLM